jgi:hypothetical protein
MKLKSILPWFFVLGLSAALAAVYVKGTAKESELIKLREESKEVEQLRAELAAAQEKAQLQEGQVLVPVKDKEELIKLRGEVSKLRIENQKFLKDVSTLQNRADAAKAQADDASRLAEAARVEAAKAQASAALPRAAPRNPQQDACINNLRQIDGAKQQWALEHNKTADAAPTAQDIVPYFKDQVIPACPAGGAYTANAVGQVPTCSIPGHALTQP